MSSVITHRITDIRVNNSDLKSVAIIQTLIILQLNRKIPHEGVLPTKRRLQPFFILDKHINVGLLRFHFRD